jgi:hypothetical protein
MHPVRNPLNTRLKFDFIFSQSKWRTGPKHHAGH